ncbi:hypothetical protein [Lactiplantibacillus plantarum]|uniref:hypothetical protein n=1 Tax=Lactiplantibacillus plantarum TaxID=1590 RepID=UPI001BADD3DA|nr:hypothetical protein [Lactiplantibacillus plantarum]MBS0956798.1 hypothetical protein [Lactiplantibacillus plantarum]
MLEKRKRSLTLDEQKQRAKEIMSNYDNDLYKLVETGNEEDKNFVFSFMGNNANYEQRTMVGLQN